MTVQLQYVFTGKGVWRFEENRQSLVDNFLVCIEKVAIVNVTGIRATAQDGTGDCLDVFPGYANYPYSATTR